MKNLINYEILINLKSMNILSIRQSSFYQLRLTVYQTDNKNNNVFAVPFLMLKSEIELPSKSQKNYDITNTSQIDHSNNSFLSRKFIVRNIDEKVQINEMCIFKGTLILGKGEEVNKQIRIYVQLLSYLQNDRTYVQLYWKFILSDVFQLLQVYMQYQFNHSSNHFFTNFGEFACEEQFGKYFQCQIDEKSDNISYFKKYSRYLQETIEQLKSQLKTIRVEKLVEKGEILDVYQYTPSTYRYQTFKKGKTQKEMLAKQIKDLENSINQIKAESLQDKVKQALYVLNQVVYQFWKKYQLLITREYSQAYQKIIKSIYYANMQKFHQQNSLLLQESGLSWKKQKSQLFIYPFEKHETFLKLKKKDLEVISNLQQSKKLQLFVLVHGYQASSYDMEPISNYLRYKYPNILCLLSAVNQGKTQQEIQESAHRLAIQIKNYINSIELKDFQINFVCHSLGGVIGRASLKYLQLHKQKFNQFISLCSPHLGYLYHSSALISTSLWILNKVKKDPSMIELTMSDSNELDKTYIYEASKFKELNWFSKIWLFGSKQDEYVPYWSAILEDKNFFFETQSSKIYKSMLENLTKDIEDKIIRCQIIFNQKAKDLSNFIGRTAHIKILNYIPGLQLVSTVFKP